MVRANGLSVHVQRLDPPPGVGAATVAGPEAGATTVGPDGADPTVGGDPDGGTPTVVLIHGVASDSLASWYFTLAEPLARVGLRVVMYDLRGHGRTDRPGSGYALDDFVDDLAALLTELAVTGPLYLVGNSFGGTVAFGYAARHPGRVAGITALESAPPIPAWMTRVARRLGRAAGFLPRAGALEEIAARHGEGAIRRARDTGDLLSSTTVARELPASRLPRTEELAAITVPVLCVYGGRSAVVELVPAVQELFPQARTVVLPDQKHSVLIDQPEVIRQLVLTWLGADCGLRLAQPAPTGVTVNPSGGL
ncbi:alpha/beta fold hydrolase [Micromonospora echinofusca]|nr:alpha/beta hydrolase [Micromonospora echinofusca]